MMGITLNLLITGGNGLPHFWMLCTCYFTWRDVPILWMGKWTSNCRHQLASVCINNTFWPQERKIMNQNINLTNEIKVIFWPSTAYTVLCTIFQCCWPIFNKHIHCIILVKQGYPLIAFYCKIHSVFSFSHWKIICSCPINCMLIKEVFFCIYNSCNVWQWMSPI